MRLDVTSLPSSEVFDRGFRTRSCRRARPGAAGRGGVRAAGDDASRGTGHVRRAAAAKSGVLRERPAGHCAHVRHRRRGESVFHAGKTIVTARCLDRPPPAPRAPRPPPPTPLMMGGAVYSTCVLRQLLGISEGQTSHQKITAIHERPVTPEEPSVHCRPLGKHSRAIKMPGVNSAAAGAGQRPPDAALTSPPYRVYYNTLAPAPGCARVDVSLIYRFLSSE
ncbi:hypothetical protein EVAR_67421_1 [Eumeta japonica]|uniref:Uncharacterized protein n=1 Tax=Eumeta variegata TaxID=151549 RepID=A0A4C2AAJ9_EUMVA|nr:hypothetical protein EVAR_67421_1 [Eumeta japonica]